MEVVYKKNIQTKIVEALMEASEDSRIVEKIILDRIEWIEFISFIKPPGVSLAEGEKDFVTDKNSRYLGARIERKC